MTNAGLCHNATFEKSRLGVGGVKRYRPKVARTIVYWRDDLSSWRASLGVCQSLAELGVKNLIVFNTEAFGGTILDVELMQQRLELFLRMSIEEFGYISHDTFQKVSCVHMLEPLNEIDTPGWDDGHGGSLSDKKILAYVFGMFEVAAPRGIETLSPSFLGGPVSEMPVAIISAIASDGRIKTVAFHMYGRSVQAQPFPNWIWGSIEQGVNDILSYCGDMQIDLTEGGCWSKSGNLGEDAQARFVEAHCTFSHPRVRNNYLFALNDWCPAEGEYLQGKDFGLEGRNGDRKLASAKYNGNLDLQKADPTPSTPGPDYHYILGFRDFNEVLKRGGIDLGKPLENEWGPWNYHQLQRAERGYFDWFEGPEGGKLSVMYDDPIRKTMRRFRWEGSWPTFEEVFQNQPR